MSPVAKWSIVLAAGFFAVSFVLAGVFAGHLSPRGPAPMYVIAGICGVVAVLVFRIKPERSFENLVPSSRSALVTEADQDADIRDMDLTKLSAAGCGLLLSTVVVMLMIGGIAAVLLPEMFEDRRKLRSIGLITFGGMAVWFLVGRFVMKQLGLGMLRRK